MKLSTTDKKSFLIGMIMGDGHIRKGKKAVNYNISCTHNPKQYDYLVWKMEILKQNLTKNYWLTTKETKFTGKGSYSGNAGKVYTMHVGQLGTHPLVTQVYKESYISNKKIVTRHLLNQLTPLGLAIWYMDDGNLGYRKNPNGSIKSRNVTLHTEGFDSESQNNIIGYFKEIWDIEARLHKSRDKYKVWMNVPNSIKFLKLVAPYVKMVPCMHYKIDLKYEKKTVDLFN
ncbi:hypothetical protein [Bacillus sp. FJAT-50079]|uniref:hypothetical protein n=1 Tax=Bacillus sp. FJAT-50079 TaxID=2833577 RepID=UPI001BCA10B0|nr:hypothetical protein [Bacillus sp. FJAT-50079]MBS4209624.1 hypothetical protein [Bacillus sp. FJAT-50079]